MPGYECMTRIDGRLSAMRAAIAMSVSPRLSEKKSEKSGVLVGTDNVEPNKRLKLAARVD
jgi:hypothetical protein